MINVQNLLVGKSKSKRLLGKSRCRWKDNIEMDAKEIGCDVWTALGYGPPADLVNSIIKFRVPKRRGIRD
jgi:hypothetical protein